MTAAEAYKSRTTAERFAAAQGGDASELEMLVQENLALVKYIVRRFLGRGKEYDDLFQTGCVGLIKAIRRFDYTLEVRFSTYAVPMIMGEIRRYLRDDNTVHISRSLHDLSGKVGKFRQDYEKAQGRAPNIDEICAGLSADKENVLLAMSACQPVRSLSEPIGAGDGIELGDTIPVQGMDGVEERLMLQKLLSLLDEKELSLIRARFFERRTQKEVGEKLGYSQVQISRMENRILRKMRAHIDKNST